MEESVYFVGELHIFVPVEDSSNSANSRLWGSVPESAVIEKITKISIPFRKDGAPRFETSGGEQAAVDTRPPRRVEAPLKIRENDWFRTGDP